MLAPEGTQTPRAETRHDFAGQLYEACVSTKPQAARPFSPVHATWLTHLQTAIVHAATAHGDMDRSFWVGALAAAFLSCSIECVPGRSNGAITARHAIRLVGTVTSRPVITAMPGTLKRAAIEAEERAARPMKRLRIDLGLDIPIRTIPSLVSEGFRKLDKLFLRGNQGVRGHYIEATHYLEGCLEDWRCDLMLMLVLTLASSSVTPHVPSGVQHFEAGPKRDGSIFAANLVTRMLWFLRPNEFSWEQDRGGIMCVKEMTKKIGTDSVTRETQLARN